MYLDSLAYHTVPEKVFHLHEADEEDLSAIEVRMNKRGSGGSVSGGGRSNSCTKNRNGNHSEEAEEFWWNRVNLTVLDMSSNSLTTISSDISDIKNLVDLVTLNVSELILYKIIGFI